MSCSIYISSLFGKLVPCKDNWVNNFLSSLVLNTLYHSVKSGLTATTLLPSSHRASSRSSHYILTYKLNKRDSKKVTQVYTLLLGLPNYLIKVVTPTKSTTSVCHAHENKIETIYLCMVYFFSVCIDTLFSFLLLKLFYHKIVFLLIKTFKSIIV